MQLFTDSRGISSMLKRLDKAGFIFQHPMFSDCNSDTAPCPNCQRMTDRTLNSTQVHRGTAWMLETCLLCGAVWFDEDDICEVNEVYDEN